VPARAEVIPRAQMVASAPVRNPRSIVFAGVTPAGAALIDRDIGFDANDIPPNGHIDPDIRSTTRKLAEHDGRRMLSIVVRFYESNAGWPLWIRLDARGGPVVDHIVNTFGDS
jgi:hypothetical protein